MNLQENLLKFADRFVGYGNPEADLWFIGMEERGGNSVLEIEKRIKAWLERGERQFDDVCEYHKLFGVDLESFGTQRTWAKLIRCHLARHGKDESSLSKETVLDYQRMVWLREDSGTCGLELLPFPAPSTKHWSKTYKKIFENSSFHSDFSSRKAYARHMLPKRIAIIKSLIEEHQPRTILFYGKGYLQHWQNIAGGAFTTEDGVLQAERNGMRYIAMPHPVAHGSKNATWEAVGRSIGAEYP